MALIFILDDDRGILKTLQLHFQAEGHEVITAISIANAINVLDTNKPDLCLLDLKLPDGDSLTLLNRQQDDRPVPVIIMTGHHELEYAAEAMKAGAFDYVRKPLDIDVLDDLIKHALTQFKNNSLRATDDTDFVEHKIIGSSKAMLELQKQIGLAARTRAPVLIQGESGTGKELVARAIHRYANPGEPFIAINCSAISPSLIESELFGHEKGAFTGAYNKQIGKFEAAGAGTILLDEVGELPLEFQSKLLRVLQEKTFSRIGSSEQLNLKARIVSASNRNLRMMLEAGLFRTDLYYRISVVGIEIAPLRDRKEDIPELAKYLLARISPMLKHPAKLLSPEAEQTLASYTWPGNVRELENVLINATLHARGGDLLVQLPSASNRIDKLSDDSTILSLAEAESRHIQAVLDRLEWNLGAACTALGISRPTLRTKIKEYGLSQSRN